MPKPIGGKIPKARQRYSIGEWYGAGFEKLSPAQRVQWARREMEVAGLTGLPCPFMGRACNKKGGVCSIQLYSGFQGQETAALIQSPVCVCPNRFAEAKAVVRGWRAHYSGPPNFMCSVKSAFWIASMGQ